MGLHIDPSLISHCSIKVQSKRIILRTVELMPPSHSTFCNSDKSVKRLCFPLCITALPSAASNSISWTLNARILFIMLVITNHEITICRLYIPLHSARPDLEPSHDRCNIYFYFVSVTLTAQSKSMVQTHIFINIHYVISVTMIC